MNIHTFTRNEVKVQPRATVSDSGSYLSEGEVQIELENWIDDNQGDSHMFTTHIRMSTRQWREVIKAFEALTAKHADDTKWVSLTELREGVGA